MPSAASRANVISRLGISQLVDSTVRCVCVWGGEKQSNCQIKCHFPVIETKVNKNTSSHPSVAVTPCSECCCVSEHKPVATAGEMQSDPESG